MQRNFPHLTPRDGDFPHIDNVNVWKYRNDFDYSRWGEQSTLSLCNVPFDSSYENVVAWESEEQRDQELEALSYFTTEPLGSNFRLAPNDTIKVPIPFDVASGANYLIVRNRLATSDNALIQYEKNDGIKDLFFFILEAEQRAPNTTFLVLKLDVWTTFAGCIDIAGAYVERGHIVNANAADVDTYLRDPLNNSAHLLTPDISISADGVITKTKPLMLDSAWVVGFILPYTGDNLRNWAAAPAAQGNTSPNYIGSYGETADGFRFDRGYSCRQAGIRSMRNSNKVPPAQLLTTSHNVGDGGLWTVQGADAQEFFTVLADQYPQIYQEIDLCAVIPEQALEFSNDSNWNITFCGKTIRRAYPKRTVSGITLSRSDFNMPQKYANLTKLYTSPYSSIKLTDLNGSSIDVRIQDVTSQSAVRLVTEVTNSVKIRAEMAGVSGSAAQQYSYHFALSSSTELNSILGEDGAKFLEREFPTYMLKLYSQTIHDMNTAPLAASMSDTAKIGYDTSVGSALAGYENTSASIATARSNTLAGIAAANSQATLSKTALDRNFAIERTVIDSNRTVQGGEAFFKYMVNTQTRVAYLQQSIEYQAQSLQNRQSANSAKALVGSVSSVASGAMTGNPVGMAGGVLSAVGGLANTAIDNALAAAETTLSVWNQSNMVALESSSELAKITNQASNGIGGVSPNASYTAVLDDLNAISVAQMNSKIGVQKDVIDTGTAISNNLADSNSVRDTNTGNANNARSFNRARTNARLNLENVQTGYNAGYDAARINKDAKILGASGNAMPLELRKAGFAVQVERQADDNIRQIGDYFLRYGYAGNRVYEIDSLSLFTKFTYWKCADIFLQTNTIASVFDEIVRIFRAGVTVWDKIEYVNTFQIYNNQKK